MRKKTESLLEWLLRARSALRGGGIRSRSASRDEVAMHERILRYSGKLPSGKVACGVALLLGTGSLYAGVVAFTLTFLGLVGLEAPGITATKAEEDLYSGKQYVSTTYYAQPSPIVALLLLCGGLGGVVGFVLSMELGGDGTQPFFGLALTFASVVLMIVFTSAWNGWK
jgi:hypothetical protein